MGQFVSEQEVQYYDISVPDWPGEIDFYLELARDVKMKGGAILEVGCGTGRVTLPLAQEGVAITGLDLSPSMLAKARQKGQGRPNVRWIEADMQAFELGETFDLIIIPGHSFQYMLTSADQVECLTHIRKHLDRTGKLVIHLDHQNLEWLGGLVQGRGTGNQPAGEYRTEDGKGLIRKWNAWSYEPSTQTASAITTWDVLDADGTLIKRCECALKKMHCVFRCEMEHLLARTSFEVEALYGDFFHGELQNNSTDMIWIARPATQTS